MNDREITQAMEACRPEAGELDSSQPFDAAVALDRDPAVRRRYEQIRTWDQSIGQAMRDVAVPEGLLDRLLAALSDSATRPSAGIPGLESATLALQDRQQQNGRNDLCPTPAIVRRRRVWVIASALVSAALVFVAFLVQHPGAPLPSPTAEFATEVIGWSGNLASQEWRTDFSSADLGRYPFDRAIRAAPLRWTWLSTPYHRQTLVYDVTPRRGGSVYLYCVPVGDSRSALPSAPPEKPFSTTGGYTIGMWQRGDLVYVLNVQGGQQRYRSLIDSTIILGRFVPPARVRPVPLA